MATMGRHSPPLDGAIANGHQLVPLAPAALQKHGPVSALPQPQDDKPARWRHVMAAASSRRAWLAAVPVVLVNTVAFGAQLGFWRAHVPLVAEAVLVALALESVDVYLAWLAHLAQLADDSALRLRLAAYGMALLIGALNYSHFMRPGWRPTVEAVTFGMMSAISPWLWSAHSRRASRDALMARNKIEPHAVRLGATRWAWHPVRSARVMWRATWEGETDPARAIALAAPVVTPRRDSDHDSRDDKPPRKPAPRKPAPAVAKAPSVADVIRDNPGLTNAELAALAGCKVRTIQRHKPKTTTQGAAYELHRA
jgi:hypothetical protein